MRSVGEAYVPSDEPEIARGQGHKEGSQHHVSDDESLSSGPICVREVKRINKNAYGPIGSDETGKAQCRAVALQKFPVESQRERTKRGDRQDGKPTLHPKELTIKGQ